MQLGGIVTQGVSAMWFPQESLKKSRLSKIIFEGGIAIGKKDYLWGTDDTNTRGAVLPDPAGVSPRRGDSGGGQPHRL